MKAYFLFVGICVLANLALFEASLYAFSNGYPFVSVGICVALALAGVRISFDGLPKAVRILLRITMAFTVFYVVTSRVSYPDAVIGDKQAYGFVVNYLWAIAAVFGVIACFRPSFGLLPLNYILWQKLSSVFIVGISVSWTDYVTVIDTGDLLILGCMLLPAFRAMQKRFRSLQTGFDDELKPVGDNLALLEALFLAAVALHFGNYFYAAVGKGIVGDNPLHWIYGNRTEFLLLVSQEAGVNPLSFSPSLLRGVYGVFSQTYWFFNLVTIVGQFVCVFTIVRVRWAIWTTVFYDLMHLSIFVLTGIFFWKYILLNFAIIMGLRTLVSRRIHAAFACVLFYLVLLAPFVFNTVFFYWLDTPAMNSVRLFAIDRNGVEYRVPSSFFLNVSMTMNQQRLIYPSIGSLPTSTWGTTNDTDVMRKAMACTLERIDESMPANKYYKPKEEIISAVLNHHRVMLAKTDENGKVGFDLYPHHMFSFPWQETEFRELDLRDIVGYKYTLEALCLGVDDTSFTRKVLWRNEFRFDIPES